VKRGSDLEMYQQASSFGYDVFGNRRTVVSPTGTLAYLYDAAHQLSTIRSGSDAGPVVGAAIHDLAGRMTRLCEGAGTTVASGTCSGPAVLSMSYAANDQLLSAIRTGAGATTQSYAYDHAGRRVRKTVNGAATHYVYQGDAIHSEHVGGLGIPGAVLVHGPGADDPLMRLTGGTNSPSAVARYFLSDGLGSVVGLVGEFVASGPVAAISVSSTGDYSTGAYPAASVINGDTTDASGIWAGNTGSINASSLTLELGGLKALSRVTVHGANSFNVNHVVKEASIQVRDAGNNWITVGAIGNNTTELSPSVGFALVQASAVRVQFAQARAAGQPVIVAEVSVASDGGAQSQASQRFDAWGNATAQTGTIPLYGYTGREPDGTGLMHYRARSYHPGLGRFTSRDPAGMIDAVTLYAYVANNPVMFTDPSGELIPNVAGAIYGSISGAVGGALTGYAGRGNIGDAALGGVAGFFAGGATGAVAPWLSNRAGAAAAALGLSRTVGTVAATATVGASASAIGQLTGNVVNGQPVGTNFSVGAAIGSAGGAALAIGPARVVGNIAGAMVGTQVNFGSRSLTIVTPTVQRTAATSRAVAEGVVGAFSELAGQGVESMLSAPVATQQSVSQFAQGNLVGGLGSGLATLPATLIRLK
jgi:RHS repeat-associated protein